MNKERDDDTGKFASKYDDAEFIEAIEILGGAATTSEVADAVNCKRRTAYHRLDGLRDDSVLSAREVGAALLWQLAAPRTRDDPDAPFADERERRESAEGAIEDEDDQSPSDAGEDDE